MPPKQVEIIAIGDELTSGVRLDTNSQWLSRELENLGFHVGFHTTVGDSLEQIAESIHAASMRSCAVLCTGGLGPTADDLTRHAIAKVGNVPLQLNNDALSKIKQMFEKRGRTMPENNRSQAMFPKTSQIVPNPEGTAPGIEFPFPADHLAESKLPFSVLFALPGVPAEMKQMWQQTVAPRLRELFDLQLTTHHHTIHCFGTGESAIETMLPDLIQRGRDPLVGITASAATISLRISTKAATKDLCLEKMETTIRQIKQTLGELVFGENGEQLEQAVIRKTKAQGRKLMIIDFGLHGEVARRLSYADPDYSVFAGGETGTAQAPPLVDYLNQRRNQLNCDQTMLMIIGNIDRSPSLIDAGESYFKVKISDGSQIIGHRLRYSGHSSWREERAVKDVLNLIRLHSV